MTTIVVLQPGYLPWLGFFDQMQRADIFVYYDDVQFDKNGWRNRNRIKTPNGSLWLTVPVFASGASKQLILDAKINDSTPWRRKHLRSIELNYAHAPFLARYLPELEAVLKTPLECLVDLDIAIVELMCVWLSLKRPVYRSSELGISGDRSERLVNICRHFDADCYLSGESARDYLELDLFERNGIQVIWQEFRHPVYDQLHEEFIPFLSALDLILNLGPDSLDVIASGQ